MIDVEFHFWDVAQPQFDHRISELLPTVPRVGETIVIDSIKARDFVVEKVIWTIAGFNSSVEVKLGSGSYLRNKPYGIQ